MQLGSIPFSHNQQPQIKATVSGITFLKNDAVYRTRYTGNKHSSVDINGKLWLKSSELKKQNEFEYWRMKGKSVPKKKKNKPPVETGGEKSLDNAIWNTNISDLPIPTAIENKFYTINKKEVRQRILGFINTKKGKKELYFFTVTFPKGTSDDTCFKIYNIWLTSLRQYKMLHEYLWVCERQANGTIHYHIAVPHKMPVQRANAMMAGTLKTFARRGEIPFSVHQCKRYNGVDISKNRKTKRVTNFAIKKGTRALVTYLTKYVTKNNEGFTHLAWHNSRGYSSIFTGVTFTIQEFKGVNKFHHYLERDRRKWFETEYFFFAPWADTGPPIKIEEHLYELNSYLQDHL